MLNRIARHTLPVCILFLTVYTALFSLQLHFKYKSLATPDKDVRTSTIRYADRASAGRKVDLNYKSFKYNVKISKRYQHKTAYEFPLVVIPEIRVFAGRHIHSACSSTSLCHLPLLSSPHRGPPAIG